jgi:polysaccharide biosynthesis transport protein
MSEPSSNGINLTQKPLVQHLLLQQPPQFKEEQEDEEEIDLKGITQIVRRRGWWMLAVGSVVSGLVGWYLFQKPPVYKESFQLLIPPPNADSLANPLLGQIASLSGGRVDESYYATQLDLLVSNRLLTPVVEQLQQEKQFFKDEEQRQNFKIEDFLKKLNISRGKDTQIVEISYKAYSPEEVKFVLTRLASAYLNYTVKEKTRQSEQKLSFLDEQIPIIKQRILLLQKRLEQFRLKNNFIDPVNQGGVIADGLRELNRAKQTNKAELKDAIALYQNLGQQLGISQQEAVTLTALNESPRYRSLVEKLQQIDTQLANASTRFTEDSPIVQQLQAERNNLLILIDQAVKIALKKLPINANQLGEQFVEGLVEPNSIRQNLTAQLLVAINQVKRLQARQSAIVLNEQEVRQQVQNFARSAGGYGELAGELEIENQSLASLLTARQLLQIETAKSFSPWELVSEIHMPEKPESQLSRNILLSLLAGLVSAVAIGIILENSDTKLQTSEDLARLTESKILGTIPLLKSISHLKYSKNLQAFDRSLKKELESWVSFLESYAFLYTNLFFLRQRQSKATLVISSASPGEGKSTTSFFLAQAAANMRHKVLLVDGDRYFPQKEYWQTLAKTNQSHSSDSSFPYFNPQTIHAKGMNTEKLRDNFYIMQYENLSLSMMMEEKELQKVINDWKSEFDLILIDAPPILGLSDTKLIANQSDGILLVARMGYTDQNLIKEALLELKLSNLPVMGLIINGSTDNSRREYYKYYQSKSQKMIV